jgi:UDP-glucose 4-epimerase
MKVLIPGIAGAIGRKVAAYLAGEGHEVIGIDARPWPDAPKNIEVHNVDIRKRAAEDVFRKRRPEAVIHMATVTSIVVRGGEERHKMNLGGTRAVFEYSRAYGVAHCIFVGRHTFYGAAADLPLFHTEEEPPMALTTFADLADLVAADLFAANALWRDPELVTSVLRVCYTLGASGHGTLAAFLRGPRVPTVLGFDPLFQFMHEDDVVRAIALTLQKRIRGIFNVAGPQPIPLTTMIREAGRKPMPIPEFAYGLALGRFGLPHLPPGALAHIKYPIVVDASAFRQATDFKFEFDESQTIRTYKEAFPLKTGS